MHFQRFYLSCLAHASYLVGDEACCAIVDPQRDVDGYLAEAERRGLQIRHVIETHLHADFVSGHVELARRTGATIHIGRRAGATFPHQAVSDGDEIRMGAVRLRFLETPGHTPESLCVLVFDHKASDRPLKVLTGDTLFIGDVGRPDLVESKGLSAEQAAGMLYDSLHGKLLLLPDEVEVCPAHGAGSACGKSISKELSSTLGQQKALNYALAPMSRAAFVALLTRDLPPAPPYFPASAELNRQGAPALSDLPEPPRRLPADVARSQAEGAFVLDVRDAAAFGAGHVPGALNVGLGGQFASWVGTLLPVGSRLLLVAADEAGMREARMRLARVGYHDVVGWLSGVDAWRAAGRPLAVLPQLGVDELAQRLAGRAAPAVLDVRRTGEHDAGHVPGARNVPLHELVARLAEVPAGRPLAVICQGGYRSSVAASLLLRAGLRDLCNVTGGTGAWIAAGHPTKGAPARTT